MAAQYINYPLISPFKMVPRATNPSILGLDSSWACEQIRAFEIKATYKQKWQRGDTTKLQRESTLPPNPLKVIDRKNKVHKSIPWTTAFDGGVYKVYELDYNIDELPDGTYYNYEQVFFSEAINFRAISEPILLKDTHINTLLINYKNSFNRDDVAWSTGIDMNFRCECDIQDFEPERDRTDHINQLHDTETIDGIAFREYQFYVGDTKDGRSGVAPYILDILNRIFVCDFISINDKLWQTKKGSNWKIVRSRGYPLIGASIEFVEQKNVQSMQQNVDSGVRIGLVTAYNIETGFFGPVGTVPVTEVEENG